MMRFDIKFLRSHVSRRIAALFFIAALLPTSLLAVLTYRNATQSIKTGQQTELIEASRTYAQAMLGRLLFAQTVFTQAVKKGDAINVLASMSLPMFESIERQARPPNKQGETPLRIELTTLTHSGKTLISLIAPEKNDMLLLARLRPDYLWGDRGDINSAYNICIYTGALLLHCSYPDELQQARGINSAQQGQWELFLKPTLQVDTWTIVTSRRFPALETDVRKSLLTYLTVALLSVLLILLLSLILIRRTMVPLEKLIEGTRRIALGDYKKIETHSRDEFGDLTHAVNNMSEKIRQQLDALQIQALFDALTGLLNRRGLEQKIAQIMQQNTPAAVLFIDVDRFKLVNDGFGHKVGDQLLREIAARIVACNHLCVSGRLGGDEFIILLDTADHENVTEIVALLMASLGKPFTIASQQISITTSIGIALHPSQIKDGLTLIERADIAMYRGKQSGRNSYRFYSEEMNAETHQRLVMEESLRHALTGNEFLLHYQPKVDISTGAIIGAEALVRWNHPVKGLVFPAHFIGLAEETGLIVPLGTWVMQEACRQAMIWRNEGFSTLRIAVNVSPRQFAELGFIETVRNILRDTGLTADGLEIEVTESMLMNDVEHSIMLLNALSQLGVCLSIDDFGTGYSSLAYLKRFPIDILKIDQSFVRDLVQDNDDRLIVSSIIALAHNLELRVVAEGVETKEQLDYLKKQNCDEMQGYYFSPPVEVSQFSRLLQQEAAHGSQS